MESMEDILKELSIVTAKYPDQWVYDVCRMRCQDRLYTNIAITLCKWIYNRTYDHLREYHKKLKKTAKTPTANPPRENYEHTGLGLCGLGMAYEIIKKQEEQS